MNEIENIIQSLTETQPSFGQTHGKEARLANGQIAIVVAHIPAPSKRDDNDYGALELALGMTGSMIADTMRYNRTVARDFARNEQFAAEGKADKIDLRRLHVTSSSVRWNVNGWAVRVATVAID